MSFDVENEQEPTPSQEPNTSDEQPRGAPGGDLPGQDDSAPRLSEFDSIDPLSRIDLSPHEEESSADQAPTTGPLSKRRTNPLRRKRKTGELTIPGMELDNPHPVTEEGWLKSMTGKLLGREEPPPPETPITDDIASRLNRLTAPLEDKPDRPVAFEINPDATNALSDKTEDTTDESVNWVSPFFGSGTGLTSELTGLPPEESPISTVSQKSSTFDENDAEWQSFLTHLQQDQPQSPEENHIENDAADEPDLLIGQETGGENQESDLDSYLRLAGLNEEYQASPALEDDNPKEEFVSWDLPPEIQMMFESSSSLSSDTQAPTPFSDESQEDYSEQLSAFLKENAGESDDKVDFTPETAEQPSPFLFSDYDNISTPFVEEDKPDQVDFVTSEPDISDVSPTTFIEWPEPAENEEQADWLSQAPDKIQTSPLARRIEHDISSASPLNMEENLRSLFETEEELQVVQPEAAPEEEEISEIEFTPEPVEIPAPVEATGDKKNRRLLIIAVGLSASLMFLSMLVLAAFLTLRFNLLPLPFLKPQVRVETPVVSITPVGLELTGGWVFMLQEGELKNGDWVPQGPEWLAGTELRRIVALPMNDQLRAVIETFKAGDPVRMLMSNNDVLTFRVDQVLKVKRNQTDLMAGNSPALIIVLYSTTSDERWAILCH